MNRSTPYGMVCPITRACEILEPRWTIPILVGLWAGATKFNEIRREIGSISPALLSRRLKELEALGLVERHEDKATGSVDYFRTEMAIALEPALDALAHWAQRHVRAELALCTATASNLAWKMRKNFVTEALPNRRVVIQFHFNDHCGEYDTYWALHQPGHGIEMCSSIPGYDIDLFVEANVPSILGYFLGRTTLAREIDLGEIFLSGDPVLIRTIDRWLVPGEYAGIGEVRQMSGERDWARAAAG